MNKAARVSLFVTALPLFMGCSGYRLAYLPGDIRDSAEISSASTVEAGKRVRLTLPTGEKVEGIVSEVTDSHLEIVTISPDFSLAAYDAGQLARIEVYVEKPVGAELGAAALVVGGLVGGYYLVNSGGSGQVELQTAK